MRWKVRPMNDITYPRFLELCDIDPSEFGESSDGCFDWYEDLRICPSGVYLATCPFGAGLTREERAALPQHPTGNYAEPILTFPASLNAVLDLLEEHGLSDCVDERVLAELGGDNRAKPKESIMERRLKVIARAVDEKGYQPLAIPDVGKRVIREYCLKDTKLFTDDTFEKAWTEAGRRGIARLANAEKYAGRR
jgi:hypothetical protein